MGAAKTHNRYGLKRELAKTKAERDKKSHSPIRRRVS